MRIGQKALIVGVAAFLMVVSGCMAWPPSRASMGRIAYAGLDYDHRSGDGVFVVVCTEAGKDSYFNEDLPMLSTLLERISPGEKTLRNVHLSSHRNCLYLRGETDEAFPK